MHIKEFISKFSNHPVLFVGTGISLRYLNNSFTWDALLNHISKEMSNNEEYYLDLKDECFENGIYHYDKIATRLENDFTEILKKNRNGNFKEINDEFYNQMKAQVRLSRFKIYISKIFETLDYKSEMKKELQSLKKVRKNIGSVITTNYDRLIEEIFEFNPLIGNDILLSNPYGSVYKIHGCVGSPEKIIITKDDYETFDKKYELIRSQLLSLFIHNPIIFIGYSINDENIKEILKTIFTYVDSNSPDADKIRSNFLLIEYENNSSNTEVTEHDIILDTLSTIRINKIKTDNYLEIFEAIASLQLPISAMDVRKVATVVKEIYSGGSIQVSITEDLERLENGDKVLVIGSNKTIQYEFQTSAEMMVNYFKIIDESNNQLISLIDKIKIQSQQYFPIYGFSKINSGIKKTGDLKEQQKNKLMSIVEKISDHHKTSHRTIEEINNDIDIPKSKKIDAIINSVWCGNIGLDSLKIYLISCSDKKSTDYRKLLCLFDFKKYEKDNDSTLTPLH